MPHKDPIASSRRSIKLDRVAAKDYVHHRLVFSCEDCSHFANSGQQCTLGFPSKYHLRENQRKMFELSGHMALCRFLEID
jgi:hypothetical protein